MLGLGQRYPFKLEGWGVEVSQRRTWEEKDFASVAPFLGWIGSRVRKAEIIFSGNG